MFVCFVFFARCFCRPLARCRRAATLKIRCDRWQKAFGKKHWTKVERNHRKYYQTKLVCQACRADGFHAWNLRAYPCHMCAGMFGSKRYDTYKLQYYQKCTKRKRSSRLICKDCQSKIRCDRCQKAFDKECWTKKLRDKIRSDGGQNSCARLAALELGLGLGPGHV